MFEWQKVDGSIAVGLTDLGSLLLAAILLSRLLQPRTGSSRNLDATFPWVISALSVPSVVFDSACTCLEIIVC